MDAKDLAEIRIKILGIAVGLANSEYEDSLNKAVALKKELPNDSRVYRSMHIAKTFELNYVNPESGEEWFELISKDTAKLKPQQLDRKAKPSNSGTSFFKKPIRIKK
tara:strand:- start:299 stop:619 length:321 start_codon:yes stop_codon:yes gene_type:complete